MARVDREKAEKESLRAAMAQELEAQRVALQEKREKKRLLRLHRTLEEAAKYQSPAKRRRVRKNLFGDIIPEEEERVGVEQGHQGVHTASSEGTNNPSAGGRKLGASPREPGEAPTLPQMSKSEHNKHRQHKEPAGLHLPSIHPKGSIFVTETGEEGQGSDVRSNRKADASGKKKPAPTHAPILPGIGKKEVGIKSLDFHPPVDFMIQGNLNLPVIAQAGSGAPTTGPAHLSPAAVKLLHKQQALVQSKHQEAEDYRRDDQQYVDAMMGLSQLASPGHGMGLPKISPTKPSPIGAAAGPVIGGGNSIGKGKGKKTIHFTDGEEEVREFGSPRWDNDAPDGEGEGDESNWNTAAAAPGTSVLQQHLLTLAMTADASIHTYHGPAYIATLVQPEASQEEHLKELYMNGFALLMQQ